MAGSREADANEAPGMAAQAHGGEATPQARTETRGRSHGRSRVRRNAGEVVIHERVIRSPAARSSTPP